MFYSKKSKPILQKIQAFFRLSDLYCSSSTEDKTIRCADWSKNLRRFVTVRPAAIEFDNADKTFPEDTGEFQLPAHGLQSWLERALALATGR